MDKKQLYQRIQGQLETLFASPANPVSRMATMAALLKGKFPNFLWTGFYLLDEAGKLRVGPYQGPLACIDLPYPNGVCWKSIIDRQTVIVPDVHKFQGHIACDARSNSEIVVPLFEGREIRGVLDIDSRTFACFDEADLAGLTALCGMVYS